MSACLFYYHWFKSNYRLSQNQTLTEYRAAVVMTFMHRSTLAHFMDEFELSYIPVVMFTVDILVAKAEAVSTVVAATTVVVSVVQVVVRAAMADMEALAAAVLIIVINIENLANRSRTRLGMRQNGINHRNTCIHFRSFVASA